MTTRDPDLCVITCAVSGVLANRKQCAYIPYTPAEIAEECKRAYDAGASVVHIHARNDLTPAGKWGLASHRTIPALRRLLSLGS